MSLPDVHLMTSNLAMAWNPGFVIHEFLPTRDGKRDEILSPHMGIVAEGKP